VRKSAQVLMGALTLGSVVTGIQLGSTAKSNEFQPSPIPTNTPEPTPTDPSATGTPTPDPTTSPTAQPTKTPTTKPAPQPATVSHTSDPVYYRYGVVQVTVTKNGSKITDIQLNQATATNGRSAAFSYLVQVALSAQGSGFDKSMLSGATFTADAFTQALDGALNQF